MTDNNTYDDLARGVSLISARDKCSIYSPNPTLGFPVSYSPPFLVIVIIVFLGLRFLTLGTFF